MEDNKELPLARLVRDVGPGIAAGSRRVVRDVENLDSPFLDSFTLKGFL